MVETTFLQCPICASPFTITKDQKCLVCLKGHSYDISKQGYVNLCDGSLGKIYENKELFAARRAVYNAGFFLELENNLETINKNTYSFNIGKTQIFQANKGTPLWSEFNRIESACLLLYNTLKAHKESLPRLAFTLGSQKGLRV